MINPSVWWDQLHQIISKHPRKNNAWHGSVNYREGKWLELISNVTDTLAPIKAVQKQTTFARWTLAMQSWSTWALERRRAAAPVRHLHLVGSSSSCYSSDQVPHANSKQRLWAIALQDLKMKRFFRDLCSAESLPVPSQQPHRLRKKLNASVATATKESLVLQGEPESTSWYLGLL